MRGGTLWGWNGPLPSSSRCGAAGDSMPPLRLLILEDVAKFPSATTHDVRRRLGKPRTTIARQLQALQMLGLVRCDEEERENFGRAVTLWRYHLARETDLDLLDPTTVPEMSSHALLHSEERLHAHTDISGTGETFADVGREFAERAPWSDLPALPAQKPLPNMSRRGWLLVLGVTARFSRTARPWTRSQRGGLTAAND